MVLVGNFIISLVPYFVAARMHNSSQKSEAGPSTCCLPSVGFWSVLQCLYAHCIRCCLRLVAACSLCASAVGGRPCTPTLWGCQRLGTS